MIKDLLANPISGLANCHVKGLYSVVLQDRIDVDHGMKRIFYAGLEHEIGPFWWTKKVFPLAPHNHRQDITLTHIFGKVANWEFEESRFGDEGLCRYNFHSGLLGEMRVDNKGPVKIGAEACRKLTDRPIYLHAEEVHTVVVGSDTAAWLVEEGTFRHEVTKAYAPADWAPSKEGLYTPLNADELKSICKLIEVWL